MKNIVYQRLSAGLAALLLAVTNIIAPVTPAFAAAPDKPVYCNEQGASLKWKAQTSNGNPSHERPLFIDGVRVTVKNQSEVLASWDDICTELYGSTPTVTISAPACTGYRVTVTISGRAGYYSFLVDGIEVQNRVLASTASTSTTLDLTSSGAGTYTVSVKDDVNATIATKLVTVGAACPVATTPTISPAAICGPGNDTLTLNYDATVMDASAPIWSGNVASVTFTIKASLDTVFSNGTKTMTVTYTDASNPCPAELPAPVKVDPCGLNNASWALPASQPQSTMYTWSIVNGHLIVTAADNYAFPGGEKSHDFGLVVDSGAKCTTPVPPAPAPADPCGLNNASWTTQANTKEVTWSIVNGHLIATTTADYEFPDGSTTKDYGLAIDSNVLCAVSLPTVPIVDACGPNNAVYGDVPEGKYTYVRNTDGSITFTAAADYTFSDGKTATLAAPTDSNTACPSPVVTQPTCTTTGSLTLPVPDPSDGFTYTYEVTIGKTTTTYPATSLPTSVTGIMQGSTVHVKMMRNDGANTVVLDTDYNFPLLNCIEIPAVPKVNDPCGMNNATWIVPEDTAQVKWEILDGELVAFAHGSLFSDGAKLLMTLASQTCMTLVLSA